MCWVFAAASIAISPGCLVEGEEFDLPGNPEPPRVELDDPVTVLDVVDGDTIVVRINGVDDRVRFKGIDAPEINHGPDDPPDEPCSREAITFSSGRMGTQVDLVFDSACQGDPLTTCRDAYDRLLAYVELPGGEDLNRLLLEQGLVRLFVFAGQTFDREEIYTAAQALAQGQELGVWGAGCN